MKSVFDDPAMMHFFLTQILGIKDNGDHKENGIDILGVLNVFFVIPGVLLAFFF